VLLAAAATNKIFCIVKPFEVGEMVQAATALAHCWQMDQELAEASARPNTMGGRSHGDCHICGKTSRGSTIRRRGAPSALLPGS
jgi:hypothetical protein